MTTSRRRAEALREQANRDLSELEQQLAEGELDAPTAATLRNVYRQEIEEAEGLLDAASDDPTAQDGPRKGFPAWLLWSLAGAVVVGGVLLSVSGSVRLRENGVITGGIEGVARSGFDQAAPEADAGFDPSAYSDEALEAVIAANTDLPEVSGMRVALAERYFDRGDYSSAFPHYQAVIEADPPPNPGLIATAFARLGWIVYDGNDEVDLAVGLFDRALELLPGDPLSTYFKAVVVWCGSEDFDEAAELLGEVLSSSDLSEDSRTVVEADLASVEQRQTCG